MTDFESRLGEWLEDGVQSVPDWLVESALVQAHTTPQIAPGLRLPWLGRTPWSFPVRGLAQAAIGALGALAVVAAFVLGLISAPRIGDPAPSTTPSPTVRPTAPASIVPRTITNFETVNLLPTETADFYALIGLAGTRDAAWTVLVTGDPETGEPVSRLVRIDAITGASTVVDLGGVSGTLSPPAADGDFVWTASLGALHRIDSAGGSIATFPLEFQPFELTRSADGLWLAGDSGATRVDPISGTVLDTIDIAGGLGRFQGGTIAGQLWYCPSATTLARLDPGSGMEIGTTELRGADCRGRVVDVSAVDGAEGAVLPIQSDAIVNRDGVIVSAIDVGGLSDAMVINGEIWLLQQLPDRSGIALVELDPASGRAYQRLTLPGRYQMNSQFESGYLATTRDHVWILVDPIPASTSGPRLVRVPIAELGV